MNTIKTKGFINYYGESYFGSVKPAGIDSYNA